MISLNELNPKGSELSKEQEANLKTLHSRINIIRAKWGKPMLVTSGFRSLEDHKRIYKAIAQKRGLATIRIPMGSQHLNGSAVDISDPSRALQKWLLQNVNELEQAGLWCEDFSATSTWVHFQILPPKSGKRFFLP